MPVPTSDNKVPNCIITLDNGKEVYVYQDGLFSFIQRMNYASRNYGMLVGVSNDIAVNMNHVVNIRLIDTGHVEQ